MLARRLSLITIALAAGCVMAVGTGLATTWGASARTGPATTLMGRAWTDGIPMAAAVPSAAVPSRAVPKAAAPLAGAVRAAAPRAAAPRAAAPRAAAPRAGAARAAAPRAAAPGARRDLGTGSRGPAGQGHGNPARDLGKHWPGRSDRDDRSARPASPHPVGRRGLGPAGGRSVRQPGRTRQLTTAQHARCAQQPDLLLTLTLPLASAAVASAPVRPLPCAAIGGPADSSPLGPPAAGGGLPSASTGMSLVVGGCTLAAAGLILGAGVGRRRRPARLAAAHHPASQLTQCPIPVASSRQVV
jgi:hypothetical protein